jgi:hypothetical protein
MHRRAIIGMHSAVYRGDRFCNASNSNAATIVAKN